MIISPVSAPTNTVATENNQGSRVDAVRAMRMTTNATPLRGEPPAAQESPILADNEEGKLAVVEETQPISPQLAALARQRRALQVKERELLDKEKALEARSQGGDVIPKARLKSETLKVLQEAGVTYDDLTTAILASQGNPEMEALRAELHALKEGVDKRFSDEKTQAEQQVLAEMRSEATRLANNGDDFELVRESGSVPDVMRLIELTYRESGEVLEVSEAMKLVEDELMARNQKLLQLKKMQGLVNPQAPAAPQARQGMRTLSNKHTASVPSSAKERALAAFYGTLKK